MAVSAVLLGPTIDRRGLQVKGMSFGILSLSLGLLSFSFALEGVFVPFFLLLSSGVAGFGASFYHPTGATLLQSSYVGDRLGRYLGINGSAGSVGRALYPTLLLLVGGVLASNALGVQFFGVLGIAFAGMIFLGLKGHSWEGRRPTSTPGPPAGDDRPGSAKPALTSGVALLTVISFIRSLAFYGIISWIPVYFSFERGAGAGLSLGTMTTVLYAGPIIGQLVFGRLVELYDKRFVLAASTALSAIFFLFYMFTAESTSLVFLGLFGFVNLSGFPVFMSMAPDYASGGGTTTSNALVWGLGNTGGRAAGPLLVGVLTFGDYVANLPFAFEVALVVGLVSAGMAMLLPRPLRRARVQLVG